ncbi:MAG: DUF1730 domain-containing protein [Clostridia bacterium]|nr:DUF1730 domain-containing protein [Clostridia bacterium]
MKKKIKDIINKAGIEDVGFCAFKLVEDKLLNCSARSRIPENAKTVIICLFPYKVKEEKPQFISRYAAVPDYHTVVTHYLSKVCTELHKHIDGYQFEYFVDNSPVPEVYAAAAAGLGVVGKNGLLINKKYGSFVFIGEIVTDLEIECDNEIKYCPDCGLCQNVCPVGLNKNECLSKISQQKGELEKEKMLELKSNEIIWGCDICAEVCPLNKGAEITYIPEFLKGYRNEYKIGEDKTERAYAWRGEKPIERNYYNLIGEE